jgi:hypothetical protein
MNEKTAIESIRRTFTFWPEESYFTINPRPERGVHGFDLTIHCPDGKTLETSFSRIPPWFYTAVARFPRGRLSTEENVPFSIHLVETGVVPAATAGSVFGVDLLRAGKDSTVCLPASRVASFLGEFDRVANLARDILNTFPREASALAWENADSPLKPLMRVIRRGGASFEGDPEWGTDAMNEVLLLAISERPDLLTAPIYTDSSEDFFPGAEEEDPAFSRMETITPAMIFWPNFGRQRMRGRLLPPRDIPRMTERDWGNLAGGMRSVWIDKIWLKRMDEIFRSPEHPLVETFAEIVERNSPSLRLLDIWTVMTDARMSLAEYAQACRIRGALYGSGPSEVEPCL